MSNPSFVELSALPISLKEEGHAAISASAVSWNQKGNVLAGGSNELHLYDSNLEKLKVFPLKESEMVTAVAEQLCSYKEKDNQIYVVATLDATRYSSFVSYTYKLCIYSSDLKPSAVCIDEGNEPSRSIQRQVAINPLTFQILVCSARQLQVFSKEGDFEYSARLNDITEPKGLHILPDGSVLISYDGHVYKYIIRPSPIDVELIWKSESIDSPAGISSDSAGLIYVGVNRGIQVLSPQGMHLFTAFCFFYNTYMIAAVTYGNVT